MAEPQVSSLDAPHVTGTELVLNLANFEGPIDLLLALAREQKVNLAEISITALADQFLDFIKQARQLRLEVAADYLVTAAWLAFLKSRLLLPTPPNDNTEPPPAEMAAALRFHLQRLASMQEKARAWQELPQLGSDFFSLGQPQPLPIIVRPVYYLNASDLVLAIGRVSRPKSSQNYSLPLERLLTLEEAAARLRATLGCGPNWLQLMDYVPVLDDEPPLVRASALASTFAAALELAKQGDLLIQQDKNFGPIFIKRTTPTTNTDNSHD